jgi:hypothetical protein
MTDRRRREGLFQGKSTIWNPVSYSKDESFMNKARKITKENKESMP